jgi:hypothetical protein
VHFCLQPYVLFTLSLPLHFMYLLHLLSTNKSVLNLAIFACYSNLLLRRRRWTGILWWGVLGYALPRLPFLWCYGVFRCFVSFRVILVFEDIIYVIIMLYIRDIWLSVSTFGRMCGTIDPRSCIWWVLGFGIKLGMTSLLGSFLLFLGPPWQWVPGSVHGCLMRSFSRKWRLPPWSDVDG